MTTYGNQNARMQFAGDGGILGGGGGANQSNLQGKVAMLVVAAALATTLVCQLISLSNITAMAATD